MQAQRRPLLEGVAPHGSARRRLIAIYAGIGIRASGAGRFNMCARLSNVTNTQTTSSLSTAASLLLETVREARETFPSICNPTLARWADGAGRAFRVAALCTQRRAA